MCFRKIQIIFDNEKWLFKLKLILHCSQKSLWKLFWTYLVQVIRPAPPNFIKFHLHGQNTTLDKDAAVRAKINNSSQIGLGYQQKVRDGVTVTLSALIDGKNFQAGGHKVGLALELEA